MRLLLLSSTDPGPGHESRSGTITGFPRAGGISPENDDRTLISMQEKARVKQVLVMAGLLLGWCGHRSMAQVPQKPARFRVLAIAENVYRIVFQLVVC